MPRTARVTVPEGIYHVTARGNGNERIFADVLDKRHVIHLLAAATMKQGWEVMAYCVMDNHYHLVVRTPMQNLSEGMHTINGCYGEGYNTRHGHVGHVFQGRFFSVAFASDAHLLEACRYTVLNPVRAGLVASPAEWQWSSYDASALGRRGGMPVSDQMMLSMLDTRGGDDARATYRDFVNAGIGLTKPDFLRPRREGRPAVLHVVHPERPLSRDADRLKADILRLRSEGRTLREIGEQLGISAMTAGRYLKDTASSQEL
jgi:putative transposase